MNNSTFYRKILDRITSGVYFVDQTRMITYWNKGAEQLSGYTAAEVVGKTCSEFLSHSDENGRILCNDGCPLLDTINDRVSRQAEVLMMHKLGAWIPVMIQAVAIVNENDEILGAVEVFNDISPLKLAQARIRELTVAANMDSLTGTFNRRGLELILGEWFNEFQRYSNSFGVVFIDVNDFKLVNDGYGHAVGDQVLIGLSAALKQNLRESDVVGRWGGDEFLVLLHDVAGNSIEKVVEKIESIVSEQFYKTEQGMISVRCSFGCVIPSKDEDLNFLIKRADAAMYHVKEQIKNK